LRVLAPGTTGLQEHPAASRTILPVPALTVASSLRVVFLSFPFAFVPLRTFEDGLKRRRQLGQVVNVRPKEL
jgi:hypothetical protein